MVLCNNDECCGCTACHDVCPQGAITVSVGSGFYRPVINNTLCVNCGLCQKVCGVINTKGTVDNKAEVLNCYAAWCVDDNIHANSASGGLATEIAKFFIESGGFVVGAVFDSEKGIVRHEICECIDDLPRLAKSKYVQSDLTNIYSEIHKKLDKCAGLFIGVGCQVNAIKLYLNTVRKTKFGLLTIDLLCRGGASSTFLSEHLRYVSRGKRIENVTFRGQPFDCMLSVYGKKNKLLYQGEQFCDLYFRLFMRHTIYQKQCFSCMFAEEKRTGDITLGDFWGIDSEIEDLNHIQGMNMVLVNTNAGEKLLKDIDGKIQLFPRKLQEAITGNTTLKEPTKKEEEYESFWDAISDKGFFEAVKKIYGVDHRKQFLKEKIKYLNRRVKSKIKSMLKWQ